MTLIVCIFCVKSYNSHVSWDTLLELGPLDKRRLMKTCDETICFNKRRGKKREEITLCTIAKISGKGIIE